MAILTPEKFENLNRDIEDTGKAINIIGIITPRYGEPFKSLPLVSKEAENRGGFIGAPTLTALQAIVPSYNWQLGRDDSTGDEYRWNPAATPTPQWEPTGRNYLNEAKADATAKANAAESNAKSYADGLNLATQTKIQDIERTTSVDQDTQNILSVNDEFGFQLCQINPNGLSTPAHKIKVDTQIIERIEDEFGFVVSEQTPTSKRDITGI
ncbi:hypothetical protein NQ761_09995, partial [Acinetobacter baumannii]|nr:hypothetical protein [Acinetobacter baumannii]